MVATSRNEPGKNTTSMEVVSDREIVISRTFNARPRIVFDAWTRADLVRRWWAPKSHGVSVVSCDADVRVGGRYRYVLRTSKGEEVAFSGQYSEITPHSRLVYTSVFEAFPTDPVVVTVTFAEQDGKTRMVSREVYPTKEARSMALASGMEPGMRETMDLLDELVATLG